MLKRTTVALACAAALAAAPASAQNTSGAAQQPVATSPDGTPIFRVVVVGRTAKAINFRPRGGETKIDFIGTPLSPRARGDATVEGEDGYIEIDANFESLESPRKYGPEYLTYVLWAITPEGRTSNLGELQVSGDDGELRVTTELQAFGLIVTAEPYFAVTQPSDVVVLESTPREEGVFKDKTIGRVDAIEARYELLQRGTYLMNQDASRLQVRPLEPGAPLDLAQARNAVAIAALADAERYAADPFVKARQLLAEAEQARARGKRGDEVQQPARQAVQTAEDARLIAVRRLEEERQARLRKSEEDAQQRARAERERALAEEARRRQADAERLSAESARAAAEKARAEADAAAARLAQERQAAEAARLAADQARAAAEAQAQQARAAAEQAEREKTELRERLRQQLDAVLETRETARGLIVNISDVLFDFDRANLKPGAREKLARVAGILLTQPSLMIEVEGHTDSVGSDTYNQGLSERRANSVREYLVEQGIQPTIIAAAGFGEARPAVSNDTAAGRQQNRRVELVVSGEAIGTTAPSTDESR
jgi:outer membrane protein OmpA-like peptidoglycan-associated protein